MPAAPSEPAFDAIVQRWCGLAERRLAHYTELHRSGRWRHYYATEEQFAAHMLDVIKAVKLWAKLAGRQPPATFGDDDLRSAA